MEPLLELALATKAVARQLEAWTNEAMRPLGITGAQADALFVIHRTEPVSLRELGGLLIAESGHPSRLVDRLVQAGLVARDPSPGDSRRVDLSLTAPGRRLVARIERARADVVALGRGLLPEEDIPHVLALARQLLAGTEYGEVLDRRARLEAP